MSASTNVCRRHASAPTAARDFVEVAAVAGREVVEAHDVLAEPQQRLEQMRADEAGAAGDQPAQRLPRAARRDARERRARGRHRHQSLQTRMPRARSAAASAWHLTST